MPPPRRTKRPPGGPRRRLPARAESSLPGRIHATRSLPCVLAIGGLDPGGGAGLLADARAIARAGAFACGAAALLTVQSTSGMREATPVPRASMLAQCTEVVKHQRVLAIKVGALGSTENVRALSDFLAIHRGIPAVVDTVMLPTRGAARLLDARALNALRDGLLPRAALVTANAPEAEALTGMRVTRLDEAQAAAVALLARGLRAVLLKGGHLRGDRATDLLAFAGDDTPRFIELRAPRLAIKPVHGGGCVLASLIAGRLASTADDYAADPERALTAAVRWAKKTHHEALGSALDVGGEMSVLMD